MSSCINISSRQVKSWLDFYHLYPSSPCLSLFLRHRGWSGSVGVGWGRRGRGACARGLIRTCLLPDACSCCVSRNVSVSVARRGLIVAYRELPITNFLSNFLGLARVYRTKFANVVILRSYFNFIVAITYFL